jgi:F0F1-type ATP synthase assembly protein I
VVAAPNDSWTNQLGRYLGIAILLPLCTIIGYIVGYLLDRAFGTRFLKIAFLILGTAGGFLELIRELTQDSRNGHS